MKVIYKNKQIQKVCENGKIAIKQYGDKMAVVLRQRLVEIQVSESIEKLLTQRIGRCHQLKGNRKNQYAMDLIHPYRLIFVVKEDEIQIAKIMEIVDYH